MVVCKFFQQGSCRYGQNCRFEHIYGSKYSYHSAAPSPSPAPSAAAAVTDEQLVNQVHSDVQAVLRGGQWILSSYAPFKEKAAFPGITDLSPEEARLFIYEGKASNNLDQAVAFMNNLFKEAKTKYEQLLLKNSNITRVFRSLYKGENVASPFGNAQENATLGNNPASSVFRSAVQQTSPYGQSNQAPSVFVQSNATPSVFAPSNASSIFGQSNTASDAAKSIFAQANQTSFNTQQSPPFGVQSPSNVANINMNPQANVFGPQTDSAAKSIFAQATQNVFSSPPSNVQSNPANLFASASQSIFSQNQQSPQFAQNQNVFQKQGYQSPFNMNQNVFQQAPVQGDNNMSIYSKLEELSAEDLEAFKSEDFKMGFVPELPPPQSLCF